MAPVSSENRRRPPREGGELRAECLAAMLKQGDPGQTVVVTVLGTHQTWITESSGKRGSRRPAGRTCSMNRKVGQALHPSWRP